MAIAIWFGQRTLRTLREVLLLATVAILEAPQAFFAQIVLGGDFPFINNDSSPF